MKTVIITFLFFCTLFKLEAQNASNFITSYVVSSTKANNYSGSLGGPFIAGGNYIVTQIGMYSVAGNSQSHQIAIFDVNSNIVCSNTITCNGTAGMQYVPVNCTLTQGQEYWPCVTYVSGGDYYIDDNSTFVANGSVIQGSANTGVSGNKGFAIPNNVAQWGQHMYGIFDFIFTNKADIVHSDTLYASNTTWAAVNYVETNLAQLGDTVVVPTGSSIWYQTLYMYPGTTLQFAGTNACTLIDETPFSPQQAMISIPTSRLHLSRLTGVQFTHGYTNSPLYQYVTLSSGFISNIYPVSVTVSTNFGIFIGSQVTGVGIATNVYVTNEIGNTLSLSYFVPTTNSLGIYKFSPIAPANGQGTISIGGDYTFLIDNCYFNNLTSKPIVTSGSTENGLITTCVITNNYAGEFQFDYTGDYGMSSWATSANYGGTNNMCVENCQFWLGPNGYCVDGGAGARIVFRYNLVVAQGYGFISTHDNGRSGGYLSCRYVDAYNNIFLHDPTYTPNDGIAVNFTAGSGHIFNNIISNYLGVANNLPNRLTDNSTNMYPWYGSSGYNGWDSNNIVLITNPISFTATADSTSLYVINSNASWTPNQWVGYTLDDTSQAITNGIYATTGPIGLVYSNTATIMWFYSGVHFADAILIPKNGDTLVIHQVLRSTGGIACGQMAVTTFNENGTPFWVTNALEPIYYGGNGSLSNTLYSSGILTAWAGTSQSPGVLQVGREIINGSDPSYVPLVYPHPLSSYITTNLPVPSGLIYYLLIH